MIIHRGDIFWITPDPSGDPADHYAHPHVIVQEDVFHHSRIDTVVVCALTSNLHRATEPGNVLLDVGEGNLPKQSVVVSPRSRRCTRGDSARSCWRPRRRATR